MPISKLTKLKQGVALAALVTVLVMFLILWRGLGRQGPELAKYLAQATSPVELRLGGVRMVVELADDTLERVRGLGGRLGLNQLAGMLFIFETDGQPSFWMKDMRFPIDIMWLDDTGRVTEITENVSPNTYPQIFKPSQPIRYVLELNARFADNFNIKVGDSLKSNQL